MIRIARTSDYQKIAEIHFLTLDNSFLSSLGKSFLECLYKFLISKEHIWVFEEEENKIVGFVSFSENSHSMMKRFILSRPVCLLKLLFVIFIHPQIILKVVETALAPFKSMKSNKKKIELPDSELLSISVSKFTQAKGIGSQLLQALERFLIENNIYQYKVIAGNTLVSANKFYLKNGFKLSHQIKIHGKDISNVYIKNLMKL